MQTLDVFKALSDEVRLRILRALFIAELSVAELVTILGLPQSTVSRHLKPLRDADLVGTRREGTSVYYRTGAAIQERALRDLLESQLKSLPSGMEDQASIRRVLDLRRKGSREFFDRIAGSYGTLTQPGGGWEALAHALAAGFSGRTVADLGAGEGDLTLLLARFAASVTAVDQSPRMLEVLRDKSRASGLDSVVKTAEGDLESLPLKDASVEVAFLSQALHHAPNPGQAIREAARILRPGGLLVLLDLARHDQEWVREQWADHWLGFDEADLLEWMTNAGLVPKNFKRLAGTTPDLAVIIAIANKPT